MGKRQRGYFGIGIEGGKTPSNLGTLWRSAHTFDAAFLVTIGARYPKQPSDTTHALRHIPLVEYATAAELIVPRECEVIGIELTDDAESLASFNHPERALYVLGAEDDGLTEGMQKRCDRLIVLPGRYCLNVAVAGSIVLHHRYAQRIRTERVEAAA